MVGARRVGCTLVESAVKKLETHYLFPIFFAVGGIVTRFNTYLASAADEILHLSEG